MMLDIPNVSVQIEIALYEDKIIMNIRVKLVDVIPEIFPGVYDKYVKYEGG